MAKSPDCKSAAIGGSTPSLLTTLIKASILSNLTKDAISNRLIEIIVKRSSKGMKEYGTSLAGNDTRTYAEWRLEFIEEMLDACCYMLKMEMVEQERAVKKKVNKRLISRSA